MRDSFQHQTKRTKTPYMSSTPENKNPLKSPYQFAPKYLRSLYQIKETGALYLLMLLIRNNMITHVNKDQEAQLLCYDIWFEILKYALIKDSVENWRLMHLGNFCVFTTYPSYSPIPNTIINDLLRSIARCDDALTSRIINTNPDILNMAAPFTDPHTGTVIGTEEEPATPLQVAFCLGDTWVITQMMAQHLSPEAIQTQISQFAPNGLQTLKEQLIQDAKVFFELTPIVQAIDATTADVSSRVVRGGLTHQHPYLHDIIDAFRDCLSDYLISHPVYNPYLLVEAYQIAQKNQHWAYHQDLIFLCQVIGQIQSQAPIIYTQHAAQGMRCLAGASPQDEARIFQLQDIDESGNYRPIESIGESAFINTYGQWCGTGEIINAILNRTRAKWIDTAPIERLVDSKFEAIEQLMQPTDSQQLSLN